MLSPAVTRHSQSVIRQTDRQTVALQSQSIIQTVRTDRQRDRQWHCSHSPSFKQSAQTDRQTDSGTAVTVRHSNSPHRQTDRQTNSGTAEVACFNHNISHSSGMTCIYDHSHCSHLPAKGSICKWNEPLLLGQKSITTLWLVPNYTARSQRHACVM